jgi:hypothetical protein
MSNKRDKFLRELAKMAGRVNSFLKDNVHNPSENAVSFFDEHGFSLLVGNSSCRITVDDNKRKLFNGRLEAGMDVLCIDKEIVHFTLDVGDYFFVKELGNLIVNLEEINSDNTIFTFRSLGGDPIDFGLYNKYTLYRIGKKDAFYRKK